MSLNKLLDINYIKRNTPNYSKLKVKLRKFKNKGVGLYATKKIKEDEIVAHYKITVFRKKGYKSPTDFAYSIEIKTKNGNTSSTFLGDLTFESLPPPCKKIPFWGFFSNEPSGKHEPNCYIDPNLKSTYKNRKVLREGDTVIYNLLARWDIKPGEELTWCYGEDYERDYESNCFL